MTTILYFLQKKQADSAEYFVCLQGGGSGVVPPLTDVNATGKKYTVPSVCFPERCTASYSDKLK